MLGLVRWAARGVNGGGLAARRGLCAGGCGLPQLAELKLRRWAHLLGFRGHVATRSRAYSTTLGRLRAARRDYQVRQRHGEQGPLDPWGRPLRDARRLDDDEDGDVAGTTLLLASWRYAGRGHRALGDAWLAETAAARAREHCEVRRLEALAFPQPTTD